MRALIQRVTEASVKVDGETIGEINQGLLVLFGVGQDDTEDDLEYMVDKILGLRIFNDEDDKMNLSLKDIGGELLVVSQFTLYGSVKKGKRPSFSEAARPEKAEKLYEDFVEMCRNEGVKVETGKFAADMKVSLVNDGPVTILVER